MLLEWSPQRLAAFKRLARSPGLRVLRLLWQLCANALRGQTHLMHGRGDHFGFAVLYN